MFEESDIQSERPLHSVSDVFEALEEKFIDDRAMCVVRSVMFLDCVLQRAFEHLPRPSAPCDVTAFVEPLTLSLTIKLPEAIISEDGVPFHELLSRILRKAHYPLCIAPPKDATKIVKIRKDAVEDVVQEICKIVFYDDKKATLNNSYPPYTRIASVQYIVGSQVFSVVSPEDAP